MWDGSGLGERQHARQMDGLGLDWAQQQRMIEAERYGEPSESSDDDAEDDDVSTGDHADSPHACMLFAIQPPVKYCTFLGIL